MMRTFAVRCVFFVAVVVGLQTAIAALAPAKVVQFTFPEKETLDRFLAKKTDILFFGDSTLATYSASDRCRKSIDEFLQDRTTAMTVGGVSHGGYHAQLYEDFCGYVIGKGPARRPTTCILPINLRSFGPSWHLSPSYAFAKERLILRTGNNVVARSLVKPLCIFKGTEFLDFTEAKAPSECFSDGADPIGTLDEINAGGVDIKIRSNYTVPIAKDHPKLLAFRRISKSLKAAGIEPIVYLTPIDRRFCENRIGVARAAKIDDNIAFLKDQLAQDGIAALDLAFALDSDAFIQEETRPTEHLNERGRAFVAARIAHRLNQAGARSLAQSK
jgi:hypothetical protein